MHIGVDLDGVVIDHTANFLAAAKERGYRLAAWQTNSNVLKKFVSEADRAALKNYVYGAARGGATIYPQALEFFKTYRDFITIVSVQRSAVIEQDTRAWLRRHGIMECIPEKRIILVRSRDTKLKRIARLAPDVFIDDGLDVLEYVPRQTVPILFDPVGVHRRAVVPSHIRIASRWNGVARLLDSLPRDL
jgi:hypothetical protein